MPDAAQTAGPYDIHSQARGAHWIAWISRGGTSKPERAVVLVGETQEVAEAAARKWAESLSARYSA